jgi:uncharacterized protein (DUF1778 family)
MELERRRLRQETIHVRVYTDEREKAELAAATAGVSLSDLVRAGLREATRSVLEQGDSGEG